MDIYQLPEARVIKDFYGRFYKRLMDNKKDIHGSYSKNELILNKRNGVSVFLNKKTEKLAAAVYMLSDFMPAHDPLRTELRGCVLELLAATLSGDEGGKDQMARLARKLLSLLQVAHYSKLISDMNHSVFRREIDALIGHIEGRFSRAGEVALSSVFFQVESLAPHEDHRQEPSYKRHNPHKDLSFIKQPQSKANKSIIPSDSGESEKDKRHKEILSFFKNVKSADVSIKDISAVMKDCSEKTIQRELIDSVQKGLLRKVGERRWSRYFLVS